MAAGLLAALAALHAALAAHAAVGTPVANVEMPLAAGGSARALADGTVGVLVFFRPNQERSAAALRELAPCAAALAGKPLRWVGVVSDAAPAESAAALAREAKFTAPVLIDRGDALYGSLGVALHPVAVVVGRDGTLAAFEPYRSVDYCTVVTARIRHALGELSEEALRAALEPPKSAEGGDEQVARRYLRLAEAQFKAGGYDKALDSVRKSLEKGPSVAAAQALLGEILAAQGNCAQALPAFERALALDAANAAVQAGAQRCRAAR